MRALVQKLSAIQEAAVITAIFAGWFIIGAALVVLAGFPSGGGPFDNAAALSLVIFECAAFCVAATVLRWRGWTLSDFAFAITSRRALLGLVLLWVTYVADFLVWELAGRQLVGDSLLNEVSEFTGLSFGMALLLSVVNGTFEEFFLCRYLIERFRDSGAAFAITLSACIRMLYHVYQGPYGTLSILVFGMIIGTYYWRTRALGTVVITHVLADLLALT